MSRPRTVAALTAGALTVAALAGCSVLGDRSVPRSDLEGAVKQLMEEQSGQQVDSVSCDGDLAGEVGASVRCTATAGGEQVALTVTTTDVDGNDVRYEVRNDTASPTPTPSPSEPTPSATTG
ncbi:DUF4333 domain-containing protein [Jiangella rhizosphaerae]|uniref:DUF4333 domain-containing protein n=1 Tax=Jiangella rhizosphaerae TaxID=2293569 RepID=A0A418KIB3_9ACTN|nr:DUF4333 domain-containing protein [Jiangella rhizosphaerae]RIQ12201.1 DUF4333 domain-containing protein [Jiangella rhizosphaerae]